MQQRVFVLGHVIVGEHGGIIECDSTSRGTVFRVLMPAWRETSAVSDGAI